jgi:hypothetical protein
MSSIAPLSGDKRTFSEPLEIDAIDPGCVKTASQIGIVSGFPETIDAKVH